MPARFRRTQKPATIAISSFAVVCALILSGCSTETVTVEGPTASSTSPTAASTHNQLSSPSSTPYVSPAAAFDTQDEDAEEQTHDTGISPEQEANPVTALPAANVSDAASALTTLQSLPVKGRAPKTGYSRDQFGHAWTDTDRNGCDTRNDILRRDLYEVTVKPGTRACTVLSGTLEDPYTGVSIHFRRGKDTSRAVQIDHVVALSDAWQTGAQELSKQQRIELANDPDNLLAVDGAANQQKSDADAATWLPANKAYRCIYVEKQVRIKAKYGLWVKAAEKEAMVRVLNDCVSSENSGTIEHTPVASPITEPTRGTPQARVQAPTQEPDSAGTYYKTCAEAQAAGAAPIRRGQPGYRAALDRDGDGVACEVTTKH